MTKTLFKVTQYAKTDFTRIESCDDFIAPITEDIFKTKDEAVTCLKNKWTNDRLKYDWWYDENGYTINLESNVKTLTTVNDGLIGYAVLTKINDHTIN